MGYWPLKPRGIPMPLLGYGAGPKCPKGAAMLNRAFFVSQGGYALTANPVVKPCSQKSLNGIGNLGKFFKLLVSNTVCLYKSCPQN